MLVAYSFLGVFLGDGVAGAGRDSRASGLALFGSPPPKAPLCLTFESFTLRRPVDVSPSPKRSDRELKRTAPFELRLGSLTR